MALTSNMNSTNLIIMLGMMQLSKKIPVEDPNVLLGIRVIYVLSNLIIFGIYLYMHMQINKRKGMSFILTFLSLSQKFMETRLDNTKICRTTADGLSRRT